MQQMVFNMGGGLSSNVVAGGFTDIDSTYADMAASGAVLTVIDITELTPITDGLITALEYLKDLKITNSLESAQRMVEYAIKLTGAASMYRIPPNSDFTEAGLELVKGIAKLVVGMVNAKLFKNGYTATANPTKLTTDADPWFNAIDVRGKYLYLYRV